MARNQLSMSIVLALSAASPALAGIVTVTGPDAPSTPFAQLADAMAWVDANPGNDYTVHAQAGRYDPFEVSGNALLTWGNSPGTIDIGGNFRVRSTGQMLFEIGGRSNANAPLTGVVDYDTVLVDGGNVLYQGRLNVSLVNGFVPVFGDRFEVIASTGTVTWDAATAMLNAPALGGGLSWQIEVGPSTFGSPAGYGTFANSLFVTVVPAPGAGAIAAVSLLAGARRRRA